MTYTLTAVIALLFTVNANAGLINIELSTDSLNVGDSVNITLSAENFDTTDMFWFDLNFDNSILAYNELSLSSDLTLADVNMGIYDGLVTSTDSFGLSFDFLDFFMPADGDFMIASFELIATAKGISDLSLTDFFSATALIDYDVVFTDSNSITVGSVAVSEPSTLFMMMLAGFALVSAHRKVN